MPIYEFKCSDCETFFEVLLFNGQEETEVACSECGSQKFTRVLSTTNYAMGQHGSSGDSGGGANTTTRTCPSGSCTTYEIPGCS